MGCEPKHRFYQQLGVLPEKPRPSTGGGARRCHGGVRVSIKRSRASHLRCDVPHLVQVVRVLPDEGSAEGLTVGHADRDHLIGVRRTGAQAVVTLTMDRQRSCGEAEEV